MPQKWGDREVEVDLLVEHQINHHQNTEANIRKDVLDLYLRTAVDTVTVEFDQDRETGIENAQGVVQCLRAAQAVTMISF